MKATCVLVLLASATIVAAGTWPVSQGDIRVNCPMTVGGSFDVKTNALSGSVSASSSRPTALDGSLAVDLHTLDTGISLRNEHLRQQYLEVDKAPGYDQAVLTEIELQGLNRDAPQGKGSFSGSLALHGVSKSVTGPVEVRKGGAGLQVKASFPVRLADYAIAEPRYLGVGVKDTVQVNVTFNVAQKGQP
jgi:polyisoprenoid-binding protein YceI